jgi:mono/diheme cytochrome c family protein
MRRVSLAVGTGLALLWASSAYLRAVDRPAAPPDAGTPRALLNQYCVTCHNQRANTAGLALDTADVGSVGERADVWEKVVRKMRAGMMPPPGRPRPAKGAHDTFLTWLETELDHAAAAHPDPGRTETFHRLNRTEYQNAVRDLLALDVDATSLLPADDGSFGFDNIAGVLKMSPSLMERYVMAARKISRLAIGLPPRSAAAETFRVSPELLQYDHVDGLPFGTRGGTRITHTFPAHGDYDVQIALGRAVWEQYPIVGLSDEPHEMEVSLDGERVQVFSVKRPAGRGAAAGGDAAAQDPEAGLHVRVPVTAGPHELTVTFLRKTSALVEEDLRLPFEKPYLNQVFQPQVGSITVTGPFNTAAAPLDDTPSRRRIFVCQPAGDREASACAKKILGTIARRAYRRPVTDSDVQDLIAFYNEGRNDGGFENGIEMALRRLLVSPEFLFRIERDPVTAATGDAPPDEARHGVYRVSDLELASRLSFFLWSTIPDDALLDAAAHGKLKEPAVLEAQVRRMLADERANALVTNFAGQWLYLRNLRGVRPDEVVFPDFDEDLRQGFQRETELFFEHLMRADRSVLELLKADYTFLNERVARHYGIANVYGSQFRRVDVPAGSVRGGLLGQGSVLTVTSYANRTSPVVRGKWLMENVLGTPPPPPPPDVPLFEASAVKGKVLSVRERMEEHRKNPACATCHKLMDPLGFALENFDGVGRWRARGEGNLPIDASAVLPDGTKFEGIEGLREVLLGRSDLFVQTMTEKLMVYALGRGLEHYDAPAVRAIVRDAGRHDHRFSSLILGVVTSTPFQMRRSQS